MKPDRAATYRRNGILARHESVEAFERKLAYGVSLYALGLGVERAARGAGVGPRALRKHLARLGGELRGRSEANRAAQRGMEKVERPFEAMLLAAQRWSEGARYRQIAAELGVSTRTVATYLRRYRDLMGLDHRHGQRQYDHKRLNPRPTR